MMRKADIPPAPRRGHSSSRQTLKQKLDRTPGMRLFHEEEQGPETVVHRTSSATRNFFGSLSGLRQLASKSSRSWLVRDSSVPADLNGLDTESNASSFGSMSGFGSRFGSSVDLAGLIGLEDLEVSGTPREVGSQSSHSIFFRSQLESGSRRNSLEGGFTPRHHDRNEHTFGQRDDDIGSEQFALEGVVVSTGSPDEGTMQCNNNVADQGSTRIYSRGGEVSIQGVPSVEPEVRSESNIDVCGILEEAIELINAPLIISATAEENAAIKIQAAFCASRMRSSIRARKFAALTIQRIFRGYCARKSFLEMQGIALREGIALMQQALARTIIARKQYRKLSNTVVTIQTLWLTVRSRKLKEQERAATRIQSMYRGWLARRVFIEKLHFIVLLQAYERRRQAQKRYQCLRDKALLLQRTRRSSVVQRLKLRMAMEESKSLQKLRNQERLQECSAVKIQAAYRGWIARKWYEREVKSILRFQACFRRNRIQKSFNRLRSGVCLIQGAWRLYKLRLQRNNQCRCALKIQSVVRGWIVRKKYRRDVYLVVVMQSWVRRKLQKKDFLLLHASTLTIQRAWRNYHTHQVLLRGVQESAVICIQAHYRGYIARKVYIADVPRLIKIQALFRRRRAVFFFRKACQAVLIIQQTWRAYKSRQVQLQNDAMAQAVTRIQTVYRGHLCRKNYWLDMAKVVWMQAWIRRQQSEKRYRQLLKVHVQDGAALIIQTSFRGWSTRTKVRLDLERVVLLQACARRMLVRKHYQALVKAASTIQEAWRAFNAQQKHLQEELEIVAAVKIQSFYKGRICRKLFKTMLGRVVYTQACIRRTLATKHHEELRRVAILLQRRWRKCKHVQLEYRICATVKIQSRWRCYKQKQFYQSLLQHRIDCATRIERGWRRIRVLQNLRFESWSRDRAVTLIQAHFRGKRVRMWLKRRQHAVICIESAYWSYAQRRPPKKLPVEQSSESLQTCAVGTCLEDDNHSPVIFLRESTLCGSNGSLDTFSPKSPLSVANSCVHPSSSEMHNSDCGYISSQCSISLIEDWNNVPIDELDQCLDTCLAALPLSAASSRQRSLESSRECSSTFDFVSSSSFLDHLDTATSPGSVVAPPVERTAAPASLSSEVQQDWVAVGEVYGSTTSETIQTGSGISSPSHKLYPSPSRELFVDEESAIMVERGEKSTTKSASKDEERLQHFAEIFLTMRQISLQQQRAQSAPPFPPSLAPLSSPTPPQSPPIIEAAPGAEVSSTRHSRNSRYPSVPLPPSPAISTDQPQISSQRADVILNMEELLKTLEEYCDEDSAGCDMITEGVVESGQNWRMQKTGLSMSSTPTLGIKHLKLPDVNAVLIVLVAMVVYTRTVCREVFFGTRQSHRKN